MTSVARNQVDAVKIAVLLLVHIAVLMVIIVHLVRIVVESGTVRLLPVNVAATGATARLEIYV